MNEKCGEAQTSDVDFGKWILYVFYLVRITLIPFVT